MSFSWPSPKCESVDVPVIKNDRGDVKRKEGPRGNRESSLVRPIVKKVPTPSIPPRSPSTVSRGEVKIFYSVCSAVKQQPTDDQNAVKVVIFCRIKTVRIVKNYGRGEWEGYSVFSFHEVVENCR